MKYTQSKKADKKVGEDLKKIVPILAEELSPVSIILFGGFGRGEGTYEVTNSKIIPLNDYDMYVVTKDKISDDKLEEIGKKCSNLIGRGGKEFVEERDRIYDKNEFFHVDLRWLDYNKLGKLRRINRTYELKYGSTIIYGEDVRGKIREIKIPLSESFRYLTNPVGHLLLCMDSRRQNGNFKKDEKFYLLHHIVKAYLAIASSLIISNGKFEPNYRKTVEECKKAYENKFPELIKKIEWALDLKLSPENRRADNIRKLWREALKDLVFTLKYISKKNYGIKSENMIELTRKIYKKIPYVYFTPYIPLPEFLAKMAFPSQYLLNVMYAKRTKKFRGLIYWKDVGLRIILAGFLLIDAEENPENLGEAYKYIKTFASVRSKNLEGLREGFLYGFDKYYSQKII